MSGETDLDKLLALLQPKMLAGEYVFCTLQSSSLSQIESLAPIATYQEAEGLSVLLEKSRAEEAGIAFDSCFKGITLSVHSSLNSVGLTAAVANKLASHGISANVIAAHYHDHVFVPIERADKALQLLTELESKSPASL